MLIEFAVSNFRSFRDMQKLTMLAAPLRADGTGDAEDNVFEAGGLRMLKSKAIFGQNASGKSNLVKGMHTFVRLVLYSVESRSIVKETWEERFKLLSNWDDEPMFFQMLFLHNGIMHRYGFTILKGKISTEWLFARPKKQEVKLFVREELAISASAQHFKEGIQFSDAQKGGKGTIIREDSLFLTAAAAFGGEVSSVIFEIITHCMIVDGLRDGGASQLAISMLKDDASNLGNGLVNLLRDADTGLKGLILKEIPKELFETRLSPEEKNFFESTNPDGLPNMIFARHERYDEDGNVVEAITVPFADWESQGTKKLLAIGAVVLIALSTGVFAVIDEFDARFHPSLSLKIIELFHSKETNPHNAQLIIATHDATLLRRGAFRRDQICFVDKDKWGISTMRTLIEYKGVRKDAPYEREYLQGVYGGVPWLNKMEHGIADLVNEPENGLPEAE